MIKKVLFGMLLLCASATTFADQNIAALENINLVWVILAAALVFLMQAGFGLLEAGMSRAKNAVNVIMKNYTDLCIGALIFFVVGFGIMFGNNSSGWFGTSHFAPTLTSGGEYAFLLFQTVFAATAVTIASGAMAERTTFLGYILGAIFITGVIYPVFGSWVWGGLYGGSGWLAKLGFIDFAGSTVVHSLGAWCALAGVLVVGPRFGRFTNNGDVAEIPAHNMMYVALGGFILWFGWFGFNAGSLFSAEQSIGKIALNTHLSASAGTAGVLIFSIITKGKILASKTINGSLAGLVAITAGCATMSPIWAILTGFVASLVYIGGEALLLRLRIDDVVGAIPVHGFCGAWGTLAAGMFVTNDLFNLHTIVIQLLGIAAVFVWAFPLTFAVYWLIHNFVGLRASKYDERQGLDYTEHHELGYPEFQKDNLFNSEAK